MRGTCIAVFSPRSQIHRHTNKSRRTFLVGVATKSSIDHLSGQLVNNANKQRFRRQRTAAKALGDDNGIAMTVLMITLYDWTTVHLTLTLTLSVRHAVAVFLSILPTTGLNRADEAWGTNEQSFDSTSQRLTDTVATHRMEWKSMLEHVGRACNVCVTRLHVCLFVCQRRVCMWEILSNRLKLLSYNMGGRPVLLDFVHF